MAGLDEVRAALAAGDKHSAQRLLVPLLREAPTAEGWYLAAQLAKTDEQIAACLKKALEIDPSYVPAKKVLSRLAAQANRVQRREQSDSLPGIQRPPHPAIRQVSEKGKREALPTSRSPLIYLALGVAGTLVIVVLVIGAFLLGRTGGTQEHSSLQSDANQMPTSIPEGLIAVFITETLPAMATSHPDLYATAIVELTEGAPTLEAMISEAQMTEEACPALQWYREVENDIVDFLDATETAVSTPRMNVTGPIQRMQSAYRAVQRHSEYPACVADARRLMLDGMRDAIAMMQEFAAQNDIISELERERAKENFFAAADALEWSA